LNFQYFQIIQKIDFYFEILLLKMNNSEEVLRLQKLRRDITSEIRKLKQDIKNIQRQISEEDLLIHNVKLHGLKYVMDRFLMLQFFSRKLSSLYPRFSFLEIYKFFGIKQCLNSFILLVIEKLSLWQDVDIIDDLTLWIMFYCVLLLVMIFFEIVIILILKT